MACATLKRHLEWDPLAAGPHAMSPRPAKRARRILASSPFAAGSSRQQQYLAREHAMTPSVFQDAAPKLTSELIASSVCNEVRRLQRRKQLPFGQNGDSNSPPLSPRSGASDTGAAAVAVGLSGSSSSTCPLFTFKQVNLICERMLREREDELRQHYDRVLNDKLAEQYDAFVRFTQDQIHRRFADDRAGVPSYCS
ncbi:akirin-like [Tropilaelaps mercedesae]|uniref:Akirin-like n=1 Tax=Tropilaelaps mercedesae TaxID=418985 RepID=A0A1V9WZZ4_9ACAR|nr:akirin-like [Tropilaelaps mercedesae]